MVEGAAAGTYDDVDSIGDGTGEEEAGVGSVAEDVVMPVAPDACSGGVMLGRSAGKIWSD